MKGTTRVKGITGFVLVLGVVTATVAATVAPVPAQEDASRLPATEAEGFLGEWILSVESEQGERALDFSVEDVDGFTRATIEMPGMEKKVVEHVEKSERGLVLYYDVTFGEQLFDMVMTVERTEDGLIGRMADESGLFTLAFTGLDRAAAEAAGVTGEAGGNDTTKLVLGDAELAVRFDRIPVDDAAYEQATNPTDGEVIAFTQGRPSKLWTPIDLAFGEEVIETHNQGPDYPGVYSLWLRNRGGRWYLVFNELPDVWGTQHDPAADVAEVALDVSRNEEPVERLSVSLEESEEGGVLLIRWGELQWSVPFGPAS